MKKFIPQQFSWEQTQQDITLMLYSKYFEFCWDASLNTEVFPPIEKERIVLNIEKAKIEILLDQFEVPSFIGVFHKEISTDNVTLDYIPFKGIQITLQKKEVNEVWPSPFQSYQMDLYFKNFEKLRQVELLANRDLKKKYENKYSHNQSFKPLCNDKMIVQQLISLSALRSSKLNTLFYENWWSKLNDQDKQVSKKYISSTLAYSENTAKIQRSTFKNMKPVLISDLEFDKNEKKFILVQVITDSKVGQDNYFLIQDSYNATTRVLIQGYSEYKIKRETFILIQEPSFIFGESDLIPTIRITNLSDFILFPNEILFDAKQTIVGDSIEVEKIQTVADQQFQCLIFNLNIAQLSFDFMTFSNQSVFQKGLPHLYVQQDQDIWIPALIEKINQISQHHFEICLSDSLESKQMIEFLSNKIEQFPGKIFLFWKEQELKIEDVFNYIFYTHDIIPQNIDNFISQSQKKILLESKYLITEVYSLFLKQVEIDSNKESLTNKRTTQPLIRKVIISQIEEILQAYQDYKINLIELKNKLKNSKHNIQLTEMKNLNPLLNYQSLNKMETSTSSQKQLIDSKKILDNLISNDDDQEIVNTSLFYLKKYLESAHDNQNFLDSRLFANNVIKNKMSENQFSLPNVLRSLDIITFGYDIDKNDIVIKEQLTEQQLIEKTNQSKQKESIINQLKEFNDEVQVIEDVDDIESFTEEFNHTTRSKDEIIEYSEIDKNPLRLSHSQIIIDKSISNDSRHESQAGEMSDFMDEQSIQSFVTVHSRNSKQKSNEHWKERLEERFNIDANYGVKEILFANLKQILKQNSSEVVVSKSNRNRFLVKDSSNDIQFVLAKTREVQNGKQVYIPVTVLTKNMKFK